VADEVAAMLRPLVQRLALVHELDMFCVLCWGTRRRGARRSLTFRLAPIPTAVARAPAELAMLGDAERCVTMGARSWLRPC